MGKKLIWSGIAVLVVFVAFTFIAMSVDVQAVGPEGSEVGLATVNVWFNSITDVHMDLYDVTDWLGAVPFCICGFFGLIGLSQWIGRKNILKVDADIIALGVYYIIVIAAFFFFNWVHLNYRPVLIEGVLEPSYPSSTTLLVLAVVPTAIMQVCRRVKGRTVRIALNTVLVLFGAFMVVGRIISGVHWLTDIIGGMMLSCGLALVYGGLLQHLDTKEEMC